MKVNARFAIIFAAVLAYTGLAGFYGALWPVMGGGMRVVATLGFGMLLHMLAMMAWQSTLPRLAGNIILPAAALVEMAGWFVLLGNNVPQWAQSSGGAALVMLVMAVQEAAVFHLYRKNILAFFVIGFAYGFALALLHFLGGAQQVVALTLGLSMLLVAYGLHPTRFRSVAPGWYVLGCCLFYAALFKLTRGGWSELIYITAAMGGYAAAVHMRSPVLLFAAAFFTIAYLSYATTAYVMQSPLWAMALVIWGVMAFCCLALAATLKRRYLS